MKAIEVFGTIEDSRRVKLDKPLIGVGSRVRVIILVAEDEPASRNGYMPLGKGAPSTF